jgi:hypothetical protein
LKNRLEFRESVGNINSNHRGNEVDSDWIVVNIPAPRNDLIHGATATTTLPLHHETDDDEVSLILAYLKTAQKTIRK